MGVNLMTLLADLSDAVEELDVDGGMTDDAVLGCTGVRTDEFLDAIEGVRGRRTCSEL